MGAKTQNQEKTDTVGAGSNRMKLYCSGQACGRDMRVECNSNVSEADCTLGFFPPSNRVLNASARVCRTPPDSSLNSSSRNVLGSVRIGHP